MSEKEIRKENGEREQNENEVEGYAVCSNEKQRCLSDCIMTHDAVITGLL